MKKIFLIINLSLLSFISIFAQKGDIVGLVKDAATGETLIGCTVLIQGTTLGGITDFNGNFTIQNLEPGDYNIIASYISYNKQTLHIKVEPGINTSLEINLESATTQLEDVKVVARRRSNTEMSMISSIKASDIIVSGISQEQISHTQDKDAAEVIRRVPGITITDGKFVIVRGLSERYNSILLNGLPAPSFEANSRAFALDAIPSSMIENILIYKSPAPELPADFAGAAINIETKQNADQNQLKFSYKASFKLNASFNNNFQTYEGGKYDWLGYEDGTRDFPSTLPSTKEIETLYKYKNQNSDMQKITAYSKDFNNKWSTESKSPFLDQSFSIASQKRFTLGKLSFGNITAINYKYDNSFYTARRTEYEQYDEANDKIIYSFDYKDQRSKHAVNLGLIHNWLVVYGNNQKIEFRNFYNNMGETSTSLREGDYIYASETSKMTNLRFKQRNIYSGQLAGSNSAFNGTTNVDWLAGYSHTLNYEPDNRIIKYAHELDSINQPYVFKVDKEVNVFNGGRVTNKLNENSYTAAINVKQDIYLKKNKSPLVLKFGAFYEKKNRDLTNRQLGISAPLSASKLGIDLTLPPEKLLVPENFWIDSATYRQTGKTGMTYKDGTSATNNYKGESNIMAGYIALKIPITKYVDLYGGVRAENLHRKISDFYEDKSLAIENDLITDTLVFYPSVNLSVKITEKHQLKLSYGKTVNHPEFREIAPTHYYDFDLNAIVHGNPNLKEAYIQNYDVRYEWYPNLGEMISLAAFYKDFSLPIEASQIQAGSTFDYQPFNTEKAISKGLEVDIRKTLVELENSPSFLRYLKNLTIIFNGSIINSEITADTVKNPSAVGNIHRVMMGQSPYIINLGLYYDNAKSGTKVNISFNKIGKRISKVGNPLTPNTWELPRNLLDISIAQKIGKRIEITFSVKDVLNNKFKTIQYYGTGDRLELPTEVYTPNRSFGFEISYLL